jgi:tetratricopeptide (TPR) repeat protein
MKTHSRAHLAICAALTLAPFTALGAVHEIPITTSSPEARLAFEAGQAAIDRGDAAEANTLFRTAVAADPDFTYAWVNLSNVTFSTEEFTSALKGADAGAAKASDGERTLLEFNKLFMTNNFGAQLELAKQLVAKYPESPRAYLLLAGAHAALNQFAEQRAALEYVTRMAPDFSPAWFVLGQSNVFNEPKDFAKADRYFRTAIEASPGYDMYYWSLGDVYRASNKLEDARRLYQLALQLDPKDPTAPVKLGHIDSFLGDFAAARKDYDAGIAASSPANAAFLVPFKALTWVYSGEPKQAIAALEKLAVDIDSMGSEADQRLGAKVNALTQAAQIAMYSGLYDDARRVLDARARLARENAKAVGTTEFNNIQESLIAFFDGQLAAFKGDYRQAAALAKKTADLVAKENNARKMEPVHEVQGLVELRRKNYPKAIAELRMADLTQLHNKYLLAQALEGAGKKEEAMQLYREVSVNNFNTVDFALLRGEAKKKVG